MGAFWVMGTSLNQSLWLEGSIVVIGQIWVRHHPTLTCGVSSIPQRINGAMFPEEKGQMLDRQNDTCPLPVESVDGLSDDGCVAHPHARRQETEEQNHPRTFRRRPPTHSERPA